MGFSWCPSKIIIYQSIEVCQHGIMSFRLSRLDDQLDGSWLAFSANITKRHQPPKNGEGHPTRVAPHQHGKERIALQPLFRAMPGLILWPQVFRISRAVSFDSQEFHPQKSFEIWDAGLFIVYLVCWNKWDWSWIYFINYAFCRNGWQMLQSAVSRCWMAERNHTH